MANAYTRKNHHWLRNEGIFPSSISCRSNQVVKKQILLQFPTKYGKAIMINIQ